jgi:hypothetical protein
VPQQVKGIARTAILRLALEQGHSVVSSDLVTEAMERFMPKRSAELTEKLAEALAIDKARREAVSICSGCGVAAKTPDPEVCTVCGNRGFEVVEPEVLDRIAALEGGVEEETGYDGRKLAWTRESKSALRAIDDRYQRRRAKARIEKAAHGRRMSPITLDFAQRFIAEETGVLYKNRGDGGDAHPVKTHADPAAAAAAIREARTAVDAMHGRSGGGTGQAEAASAEAAPAADDGELEIVARDAQGKALLSRRAWSDGAVERVLRVPAGFMRDKTQRRIEELADERGATAIDLALVEEGIEHGRRMMAEMLGAAEAQQGEREAAERSNGGEAPSMALNEVSVMSEVEKRRRALEARQEGAGDEAV